jgi:hypothetical protein
MCSMASPDGASSFSTLNTCSSACVSFRRGLGGEATKPAARAHLLLEKLRL